MIVMATHGLSGWRQYTFGSVTEKVMHLVQCPILVIPVPMDNGQREDNHRGSRQGQKKQRQQRERSAYVRAPASKVPAAPATPNRRASSHRPSARSLGDPAKVISPFARFLASLLYSHGKGVKHVKGVLQIKAIQRR